MRSGELGTHGKTNTFTSIFFHYALDVLQSYVESRTPLLPSLRNSGTMQHLESGMLPLRKLVHFPQLINLNDKKLHALNDIP